MTPEEIQQVEDIVNEKILESLPITISQESIEDARKMGAMALFGEKYGNVVRVVNMGGYSIELCGGAHLENTAQVGSFKIVSESGIASGVRRIEALTGAAALKHYQQQDTPKSEFFTFVLHTYLQTLFVFYLLKYVIFLPAHPVTEGKCYLQYSG